MTRRRELRAEIFEGEPIWTRARILRDADDLPMQPSDCTSWSLRVFNADHPDDPYSPIYQLDSQPASDILTTTYTTSGWDEDAIGYNVGHGIHASDVPSLTGGCLARTEYVLDTIADGQVALVGLTRIKALWRT